MKFIVAAIFVAIISSTAWATDTSPIFQKPDAQSKFRDAQRHVNELMKTGQYKEAAEYMTVYQKLACEAAEQKAGRSVEDATEICARKHSPAGISVSSALQQQERPATDPLASNVVAPGITVIPRDLPGTPTLLDGSTPSLFMFDPRSAPGEAGVRTERQTDPWTGTP
ncbi:hypothetical protein [Nitrosovibrio sp. Nv6]|uniref:hypothetical protein n=1 Tax=Nitrosovibrio sp. Nv6 TaxID=1855340 RepID=UPI0008B016EE|nr:hypothetical protein [Nitrosovibrio sp. Nv6]SEO48346.1 hypothetical protein SAMN05216316_0312 [Nitrosovibrio sp. Nv6]